MDRRTLLAILLCLAIFLLWFNVFLPWRFPPSKNPPKPKPTPTAPGPDTPTPPLPPGDGPTPPVVTAPVPDGDPLPPVVDDLHRQTEHFDVVFSTRGARLLRLQLLDYKKSDRSGPLEMIREVDPGAPSFVLLPLEDSDHSLASRPWKIVVDEPSRLGFETVWKDWLRITKTFVFDPGLTAHIECRFENLAKAEDKDPPKTLIYNLYGAAGVSPEPNDAPYLLGVRGRAVGKRIQVMADVPVSNVAGTDALGSPRSIPPFRESDSTGEKVRWAGSANKYFAAIVFPRGAHAEDIESVSFHLVTNQEARETWTSQYQREHGTPPDTKARLSWLSGDAGGNVQAVLQSRVIPLAPGVSYETEFEVFLGPKDPKVLDEFEKAHPAEMKDNLGDLLNYGWFGSISQILLAILSLFHALVGNYGWAIVLLTISVRLAIFPLSKKTQVSMYRMQKLQPKVEALRQRYDKDPQKLQAAMFKLYKEHGANPLSGCLPMLFQLPILISLYWALQLAIELRQSPWIGWVTDLSQPDDLGASPLPKFNLLPFVGPMINLTRFHLLPVVMIATWCIQQALTPRSPDPAQAQQQKMMMFMPILFGLMMYWTPSGLILYWMTSTMMGIGEQQLIKKVFLPRAELAVTTATASP